jgi:hypothetical protein
VRRTDPLSVRVAQNGFWDGLHYLSGGVSLFAFTGRGVNFHELSVVRPVAEARVNRPDVGIKAVCGDLELGIRRGGAEL